MDEVVSGIQARVSDRMNATLARDFTPMVIKQALFDMDPTKTPGADGMTAVSTSNIGILLGEM